MSIADAIRTARTREHLTQSELANLVGVNPVTVSRWERGTQRPGYAHIHRIAVVTDTPVSELFAALARGES